MKKLYYSNKQNSLQSCNVGKITKLLLASTLCALVCLATHVSAVLVSFSTGNSDGKIATLSRPGSAGVLETESADDFLLATNTILYQATFTGLIPSGASLSSVDRVVVEIYRIFPLDSDTNRTITVPTRVNSPSDVDIAEDSRDSSEGTLSFNVTQLAASFTASNSVVNGIHPATNQFTGGEGAVTGQEVLITVTLTKPIELAGGHYFIVPQIEVSGGNFLWLSAPKPTAPPIFVGDLQSWIRNENLAPDWLRVGTDITHQGPFNAAFSISGETDEDADGVPDSLDQCPGTPLGAIVNSHGCSIEQLVPCFGPWKNHGQFVSTLVHVTQEFKREGLLTDDQEEDIVSSGAQSDCGKGGKKGVPLVPGSPFPPQLPTPPQRGN